jgi:hypothetical protein
MKDAHLARTLAERLWEQRDRIDWREPAREEKRAAIEYPVVVALPGEIRLELETIDWQVRVEMGGHPRTLRHWDASVVFRTWRAIQAWNMAVELGETRDAGSVVRGATRLADLPRMAVGLGVRRWGGQNVAEHLDRLIAERVLSRQVRRVHDDERLSTRKPLGRSEPVWYDVGCGVEFTLQHSWDFHGGSWHLLATHPRHGNVLVPCDRTRPALDLVRGDAFQDALAATAPLGLPAAAAGNARIARIVALCREALAIDPDLCDALGTPIRPLVERHLPDLLARHAEAARIAPAAGLAELDADLDRGVEIVRIAVESALSDVADRRRLDLQEQLRFLESRHPCPTTADGGPATSEEKEPCPDHAA